MTYSFHRVQDVLDVGDDDLNKTREGKDLKSSLICVTATSISTTSAPLVNWAHPPAVCRASHKAHVIPM